MTFTEKITVLYRGSLKSCNYQCGYCPFSKHRGSEREYDKDKEQWFRFVESLEDSVGAVMVVPYGEALIHGWYWQGLGCLGARDSLDCVGAQTNLSFPVENSLKIYQQAGGKTEKLRLWATFHPEMTSVESFVSQCGRVLKEGARICVGAVGVPKNLEVIRCLRRKLPEDIYLWVNKMDGLGRSYTNEETRAFQEIDPFFCRELEMVEADPAQCQNRIFVEGDGKLRRCNISRVLEGNWYGGGQQAGAGISSCGRKYCSCYLAYGGRKDVMNRILFGPYPLFRIPEKARAVFLDIEGTLIPRGQKKISRFVTTDLELAARTGIKLFFATTLPIEEARRQCQYVWHLFSGGVFGGGAHVVLGEEREIIYPLDRQWLHILGQEARKFGARLLVYERGGQVCKITLLRPEHLPWKETETRKAREALGQYGNMGIRVFVEGNCLQVVSSEASKAQGVRILCGWLGISPKEAAAAGDSAEDEEMMALCGSWG